MKFGRFSQIENAPERVEFRLTGVAGIAWFFIFVQQLKWNIMLIKYGEETKKVPLPAAEHLKQAVVH